MLAALDAPVLNALMACPATERRALRHRLSHLLRREGAQVTARPHADAVLVPRAEVEMLLPAAVGDYTDFYASVFHATNVGKMLRPDQPLLPNYKHVPIGYHGRASSLVVSGTDVKRPSGQTEPKAPSATPGFGPSGSLDYELEIGAFVAEGNALGQPIRAARGGSATSSASSSSTTGRLATSRSGSTSPWVPSWPRASPPR